MGISAATLAALLCSRFEVREAEDALLVCTPFVFDDGDRIVVFVRESDGGYLVHDNGEAALRLMFEGVDIDSKRVRRWMLQSHQLHGVTWSDDDEHLACHVTSDGELAQAIMRVAEASTRMQAMAAIRDERSTGSEFKEMVKQLLGEVAKECEVEIGFDAPVDQYGVFTADALIQAHRPMAVIVATSAERLLEAEMIWMEARARQAKMYVLAVVEDESKVGRKHMKKAQYYTDKTVEFAGMQAPFRDLVRSHLIH